MSTPRARLNLSYSSNDSAMDIEFSPKAVFGKFTNILCTQDVVRVKAREWTDSFEANHSIIRYLLSYSHRIVQSPDFLLISLLDYLSLLVDSQSVCYV